MKPKTKEITSVTATGNVILAISSVLDISSPETQNAHHS